MSNAINNRNAAYIHPRADDITAQSGKSSAVNKSATVSKVINSIGLVKNSHADMTCNQSPQLNAAKEVLQIIRSHFKGRASKCCSKLNLNIPYAKFIAGAKEIGDFRRANLSIDKEILTSVENRFANCNELATVAYALSHKHNLHPELAFYQFGKDKEGGHVACQVMIEGEKYIIDAWTNILCRKEDYVENLANKLQSWGKKDKFMLREFKYSTDEDYFNKIKSAYEKKETRNAIVVKPEDLQHSSLISGVPDCFKKANIFTDEFYNSLEPLLAKKAPKQQPAEKHSFMQRIRAFFHKTPGRHI